MKSLVSGARALAVVAGACVVVTPAFAADQKPAGAFVQCDGRTGHVSGGRAPHAVASRFGHRWS